jgi:putative salt-induced outer membrane protein YdiY
MTLALVAVADRARAQVNVEVLRRRALSKPQFLSADASFVGRAGNVESGGFALNGSAGLRRGRHLHFVQGSAEYVEFGGKSTVARIYGHSRYGYALLDWLVLETYGQLQGDRFQKLRARSLAGAGPRFLVVGSPNFDLNVGTSLMIEREQFDVDPHGTFPWLRVGFRWASVLSAALRLDNRTELAGALYVQPRVSDFADTRMLVDVGLQFRVTQVLVARVTGVLRYLSAPPPGVQEADLEVRSALGVLFD